MLYLGFLLSSISYLLVVLLFIGYFILFFMKQHAILERFINMMFLASMICIMLNSWGLILMNGGFNVNLALNIDFSYILIVVIPVVVVYEILDTIQRRKIVKSEKLYMNIVRYLLPAFTGIVFFATTLIFYFDCNYFMYLRM